MKRWLFSVWPSRRHKYSYSWAAWRVPHGVDLPARHPFQPPTRAGRAWCPEEAERKVRWLVRSHFDDAGGYAVIPGEWALAASRAWGGWDPWKPVAPQRRAQRRLPRAT